MYVQSPQYHTLQQLKLGTGKSISQLLREAMFGAQQSPQAAQQKQRSARRNDVTPIDLQPIPLSNQPMAPRLKHTGSERGGRRPACSGERAQVESANDLEQVAQLTAKLADHPNSVTLWIQRGLYQLNLKRYHAAVEDFSQAIRLAPHLAQAYYKRSQAYYMLGEEQLAACDRQQAKQLFTGERWS